MTASWLGTLEAQHAVTLREAHLRQHVHAQQRRVELRQHCHAQSLDAIASTLPGLPEAIEWSGLNEYDGEALVRAVHAGELPSVHDTEGYRAHFRLLRDGLVAWMEGRTQPVGMPSWPDFVAGVAGALDLVRSRFEGDVLLVSSGGPIATAVAQVLQAKPELTPAQVKFALQYTAEPIAGFGLIEQGAGSLDVPLAATCIAISRANAMNSSFLATKSVLQSTSISTPTLPLA